MRIAILLLNSGRGSGEVARQQARFLVSAGCKVYFLHPNVGEGVPGAINVDVQLHTSVTPVHEHLPAAGIAQEQVSAMSFNRASAFLEDYQVALQSVIDDVDIVLGHHANLCAIATSRVAALAGKPYALFLHGTGIEPRHHEGYDDQIWALIQSAIEDSDGILVTTEYVRDCLVRNLIDLPLERFLVLPCGIDLNEFRPGRDSEVARRFNLPERFVICPGALTSSKGPQNVVQATHQYADLAPTIFIGDGELRAEIESDLDGRGRLLGFVSASDKAALINSASILTAAPEKKEHFGIIYAEGLAAGTPAVAYEGGGVASIVTPETGVLTERDPESLGRAIRALLNDPQRLATMAQKGRKRAEKNFSAHTLGVKLQEWLAELSAKRHASSDGPAQ